MAIKLIVFDIAGTTVKDNYEVSRTFQTALRNHDCEIALDHIHLLMGYEKKLAIRKLLTVAGTNEEDITPAFVDSIHKDFVEGMINYYTTGSDVAALPQVEETFIQLHERDIQVAINTGFSKDIAESVVNRLQWKEKGFIDHLIGSDEVEFGRPYPFMIEKLMKQAGISDPQEVAKVGDTEVDVREGQNAGCKFVIGITSGIFTREELEPYGPTHIIDNIKELLEIIND